MRHAPGRLRLHAMKIATATQRVILDAAVDRSVIRGTLTAVHGVTFTAVPLGMAIDRLGVTANCR